MSDIVERLRIELAQAETLILAAKVFVADYKIVRPETSASWLRDADKWLAAAAIRRGEP